MPPALPRCRAGHDLATVAADAGEGVHVTIVRSVDDRQPHRTTEVTLATWAQFEAAAPRMASAGRRLIYRTAIGEALLATVRGGGLPRIHPIYVSILGGRLVAFMLPSPKGTDLAEDGRFALHAHQDPAAPHEFVVRGRARPIDDEEDRRPAVDAWYFDVDDDDHRLFEFEIEHAILGERATAEDWPAHYTSWRSSGT